jgi:hypothetical protein
MRFKFALMCAVVFGAFAGATFAEEVKLKNSGDTCSSAADEGAVYFNEGENTFYFCQDSAQGWEALADMIPASSGGGGLLQVYNVNGVSLGYLLDVLGAHQYVVADTVTGEVKFPGTGGTDMQMYFASSNCSSTGNNVRARYGNRCGYTCTGSADCLTGFKCSSTADRGYFEYNSYRRIDGECVNSSSNYASTYYLYDPGSGSITQEEMDECRLVQNCTVKP